MTIFSEAPADKLRALLIARTRQSLQEHRHLLRESAVLLPLFVVGDEPPELLYIVRHESLRTHSGQIAFPGGKREPGDRSIEDTALRESYEEIGLPSDRVEICGLLDDVPTPGLFAITPVLGLLRERPPLSPSATEVGLIFTASLELLTRTYHRAEDRVYAGVRYAMPEFHIPDARVSDGTHRIWGATARITHQLLALLELLPPLPAV